MEPGVALLFPIIAIVQWLPTIILLACAGIALTRLLRRRVPKITGTIVVVAALWWLGAYAYARYYFSAPDPVVAAAQLRHDAAPAVDTLVYRTVFTNGFPDLDYAQLLAETPIRHVIRTSGLKRCSDEKYDVLDLASGTKWSDWHPIEALPTRYLLFSDCGSAEHPDSFPWGDLYRELSFVDGTSSILIDIVYRKSVGIPTFPPMLAISSGLMWRSTRGPGVGISNTDFVIRGIKGAD